MAYQKHIAFIVIALVGLSAQSANAALKTRTKSNNANERSVNAEPVESCDIGFDAKTRLASISIVTAIISDPAKFSVFETAVKGGDASSLQKLMGENGVSSDVIGNAPWQALPQGPEVATRSGGAIAGIVIGVVVARVKMRLTITTDSVNKTGHVTLNR